MSTQARELAQRLRELALAHGKSIVEDDEKGYLNAVEIDDLVTAYWDTILAALEAYEPWVPATSWPQDTKSILCLYAYLSGDFMVYSGYYDHHRGEFRLFVDNVAPGRVIGWKNIVIPPAPPKGDK